MEEMHFSSQEILEAQAHVWHLLLSYLKSMCLKCSLDLGIADALMNNGKPMDLADLASTLSIPPSKFEAFGRFMTTLVHLELFAKKQDKYLLTPMSHLLVKKEFMNMTPFLRLILDPVMCDSSHSLGPWFKSTKETPFEFHFGKLLWNVVDEKPEFNNMFNEGMASDSALVGDVVMMNCRDVFKGLKSLVDVGGGTGNMARAISHAFPETKCTVLDLPHVIDTLKEDNSLVDYVGGDMFVSVPHAHAALLKWILHDWNDEECVKILQRCKEAIPSKEDGGKIIIIDMVVGVTTDKHAYAVETQLLFDLLMMSLVSGKERHESEWKKIFLAAGFTDYKITPFLGLRSVIELYP